MESQLSLDKQQLGSRLFPPKEIFSKETVIFAPWIQPSPTCPVHCRGELCCYLACSTYASCRAQTLTDLATLSAWFGCLSVLGSDLYFPVWWILICCLTTLVFVSLSFRSKTLKVKKTAQTVHTGAEAG